jgi:four helix bundle protein
MSEPIHSHRELKVWELGIEITTKIYAITNHFPASELYGLTSQLRRAAVSVPANIAEGHARKTTKDYMHFLAIALASLAEVDTHLEIAKRLNYVEPWNIDELNTELDRLGKMLQSLRRSLQAKLND